MPTHFDFDVSFNCRAGFALQGVHVIVERIEQRLTYAGLLEGVPSARWNERILEPLRRAAASRGAHLVEPARRDFLRRPGDMEAVKTRRDPVWIPEWLPMVSVGMTLGGPGGERGPAYCSRLRVFFFQDEFAPPLDDRVAAALRDLDWAARAEYHEI
jgi:hypothetical protein